MKPAATNLRSALHRAVCGALLLVVVAAFAPGCGSAQMHTFIHGKKARALGATEDPNNIYNRPEHQVGAQVDFGFDKEKPDSKKDAPPELPYDQLLKEKDIH